ncbi:MAG: MFS transporter [Erysipelotrichaceae bacterium]|nr:MFS transporter [Erysipelotrichaceae bacterium]
MDNRKSNATRIIGILSAMHFMTDLICAFAVYSMIAEGKAVRVVMYNFCAFVLQMPLGLLADAMRSRRQEDNAILFIGLSIPLTLSGLLNFPVWVFGLGNALFHVGGGIITIHKDHENRYEGRGLGTFVAPGAIGLFLGQVIAGNSIILRIGITAVMTVLFVLLYAEIGRNNPERETAALEIDEEALKAIILTLLVVILRSYVGFAVSFEWKHGVFLGFLAVLCVAGGKTLGGFVKPVLGYRKTVVVTLVAAARCYLSGSIIPLGLAALLLFNMTMPITLCMLAERMKHLEGFAFGILTFGLFIGFYIKYLFPVFVENTLLIGVAGSLISLLLLLPLTGSREES